MAGPWLPTALARALPEPACMSPTLQFARSTARPPRLVGQLLALSTGEDRLFLIFAALWLLGGLLLVILSLLQPEQIEGPRGEDPLPLAARSSTSRE